MLRVLLVGAGGLLGSVTRYWLSGVLQRGDVFPMGTLGVNALGSFLLGLIAALSLERGAVGPELRTFLGVGFCGGFTTMSTFSYETIELLREGSAGLAAANATATLAACFACVWAGMTAARWI